ncbi:MAG: glycoside hydrolase family 3 C-terminal domain-containing protein [Micavibrio sp.]|nr:glycoside hydrolase family 3 C-terminal domain-containing protein [Micavibrio sp.]
MFFKTLLLTSCVALAITGMAMGKPVAAPHPWMNAQLSSDVRASLLLQAMTFDERVALIHGPFAWSFNNTPLPEGAIGSAGFVPGNSRLGIPALQITDASLGITNPLGLRLGIRTEEGATALPSGLALAASFDRTLAYKAGAMIGSEAQKKGFNVLLAGGVNLARDPRNGRNFEYLGEDPLLAGTLAGQSIKGIQDQNVVSTVKHLSINDQETNRQWANSVIDEAAHRESDLLAFELAIEGGKPGSVMCAYNRVNGPYACDSQHLLTKVLKQDWKFPGWVMSDWGAVYSENYALAGLDQQSGEQLDEKVWFDGPFKQGIKDGRIPKARLDDMVHRILRSMFEVGLFDHPAKTADIDFEADAQVSRAVAQDGIVLLKNQDDILPLARDAKRIAIIGGLAARGVLSGGGSSQVVAPGGRYVFVPLGGEGRVAEWRGMVYHKSSPLEAIKTHAPNTEVRYDDGRYPSRAAELARSADVVVVFANQWMMEAEDAPDLSLPDGQDALITAVAAANPNTIVVLQTGGPVTMPWLSNVKGVIEAWYSGARGGQAIADVLFGDVNPSGRLPVSFPVDMAQYPREKTPGRGLPQKTVFDVPHTEGAAVGYKMFAQTGAKPLFSFGYGLSYTRFSYSGLQIKGGKTIKATFNVTNTGKIDGADTPQLYLTDRLGVPVKRLIGFEKIMLKAGESRKIFMSADPRLLADFDAASNQWVVRAGSYNVTVASDADAVGLEAQVKVFEQKIKP